MPEAVALLHELDVPEPLSSRSSASSRGSSSSAGAMR